MTWFTDAPPEPAHAFWSAAYPGMATEAQNAARAEAAGFRVVDVRRLPADAWWRSYYDPLEARIAALLPGAPAAVAEAAAQSRQEMHLFRRHDDAYGYAFYALAAA
jgi:serine/threonine-protein kinase HipA